MKVRSNPGEVVLDFFAGSGTLGEEAAKNGPGVMLGGWESAEAMAVMEKRLGKYGALVIDLSSEVRRQHISTERCCGHG